MAAICIARRGGSAIYLNPSGSRFGHAAGRARRPEPDWGGVHQELHRHKGLTLQLLWLEYRAAQPSGYQYSWYSERYRAWREQLDVVMRQVYRAGEKAFC